MTLLASAPGWLTAVILLLFLFAALEDLWRLQISDWLSGTITAGAFLAMAMDGAVADVWQNLLLFAVMLGLGTLFFVRGWMGGGDVKLLAAAILWFDLYQGGRMLVAVAIAGGLEAILIMLLRIPPWPEAWREKLAVLRRHESIPYGVAIAAGVAFVGIAAR